MGRKALSKDETNTLNDLIVNVLIYKQDCSAKESLEICQKKHEAFFEMTLDKLGEKLKGLPTDSRNTFIQMNAWNIIEEDATEYHRQKKSFSADREFYAKTSAAVEVFPGHDSRYAVVFANILVAFQNVMDEKNIAVKREKMAGALVELVALMLSDTDSADLDIIDSVAQRYHETARSAMRKALKQKK
jgi:hypothetical protein